MLTDTQADISYEKALDALDLLIDDDGIGAKERAAAERKRKRLTLIYIGKAIEDIVSVIGEISALQSSIASAVEQQTATSEVLKVIAASPTDLDRVLDTITASAAQLCDATGASMSRFDGDAFAFVASYGTSVGLRGRHYPVDDDTVTGQALRQRQTVHVHDLTTDDVHARGRASAREIGYRTALATPLLRGGEPIGTLSISRTDVRPFSPRQVALLETFADQAVIAIENARLFQELQESNRQVTEALEQQTALAEVLSVIAASPTDLPRVLQTIATTAMQLCDVDMANIQQRKGEYLVSVANDCRPAFAEAFQRFRDAYRAGHPGTHLTRSSVSGLALLDRRTVYVPDVWASGDELPVDLESGRRFGHRTKASTPLLHGDDALGVLSNYSMREPHPFTEQQLALLETFASQAAIAIANARLFEDLQASNRRVTEALEQQTALGEVPRVIASSPSNMDAALQAITHIAWRLNSSTWANIRLVEGDEYVVVAGAGETPRGVSTEQTRRSTSVLSPSAEAIRLSRSVHIHDVQSEEMRDRYPGTIHAGQRTTLHVPLLRDGRAIGLLSQSRAEVRPYSANEIALLETFADQAVIAIENARLFHELEQRTADLTAALEQQTATADVLRVIASSPTDLPHVLDTVAATAARIGGAERVAILLRDGDALVPVVSVLGTPRRGIVRVPIRQGTFSGRAVLERRTVHVADLNQMDGEFAEGVAIARDRGSSAVFRSALFAPLIKGYEAVGVLAIARPVPSVFSDQQVALFEMFASQAVVAIENARLFEELQERTGELTRVVEEQRALAEVSQAVSSSLDLQQVLTTIVDHAVELSGAAGGVVYEYDETRGELHLRATRTFDERLTAELQAAPLKLGEGAVGRAALTRQPVQVEDILAEGTYQSRVRDVMASAGLRSLLALPLLREDRLLGGIVVARRMPGAFPEEVIAQRPRLWSPFAESQE